MKQLLLLLHGRLAGGKFLVQLDLLRGELDRGKGVVAVRLLGVSGEVSGQWEVIEFKQRKGESRSNRNSVTRHVQEQFSGMSAGLDHTCPTEILHGEAHHRGTVANESGRRGWVGLRLT